MASSLPEMGAWDAVFDETSLRIQETTTHGPEALGPWDGKTPTGTEHRRPILRARRSPME
jgi:hypothetical protein